jgi:hypothetical protein
MKSRDYHESEGHARPQAHYDWVDAQELETSVIVTREEVCQETLKKSASGRKRKAHGAQRPRHIK